MSNPITENIKCLIECGWERKEAVNLVAELYSQSEREELEKAVKDASDAWYAADDARDIAEVAYDAAWDAWYAADDARDIAEVAYDAAWDALAAYDKENT